METIVDIAMPMNNLIKYCKNYAKTSRNLWQYYKNNPNDNIRNSESFNFKAIITGRTPVAGNRNVVEIAVSLK